MSAAKNVLLIVVDQWRGLMLPKLGADYLKLPNIDKLCAEGVTFRNHFTQTVPCGPARASLLTGLYMMNHRAVQNTIPLDSRFTNLAHELRRGGYDPALVGYTTTTPDPRKTAPNDPRFFVLGDIMDGFHSVGAFDNRDAYFGWVASQGFKLPPAREDIWQPSWDVGVNFSWTFYDSGRTRAEAAEAAASVRAIEARQRDLDTVVSADVRQRLLDLRSSQAAVRAAETGVRAATEARRVLADRFAVGVATTTDVLVAQEQLLAAELARARAFASVRLAEARLQRAVGRP